MPPRKVMTTLHIAGGVRDQLKKMASAQRRTMSDVVEEQITRWSNEHAEEPRGERVQMDQAARVLVKAVCDQLADNRDWATTALMDAGMGLPGATVFDRRIGHYADEKQQLGNRLARWILRRAVAFLERGQRVYLVCDSGTTVFWFLKAIGDAITDYESRRESAVDLSGLQIVTNSIPGAESFVTYAARHDVKTAEGKKRMADVVRCRVLGGELLPEYVAITGPDTEHHLQKVYDDARSSPPDTKRRRDTREAGSRSAAQPPVFIGITTGNWIAIQDYDGHLFPHLLARGAGHGPFKRELLRLCDEIFVLAPLGKILFRQDDKMVSRRHDKPDQLVNRLNDLLGYTASRPHDDGPGYRVVEMPERKSSAIKLVTTLRQKNSIFLLHSALVSSAIGEYSTLDPDQESVPTRPGIGEHGALDPDQDRTPVHAAVPIGEVRHLLFPFDLFANLTLEEQLEIELPHPDTRKPIFKREFYSIRS